MHRSKNILWVLITGFFCWVLINSFFHPLDSGIAAMLDVFFMVAIAVVHGLQRYTTKQFLVFFVITFIISNIYENLSILTGFPFGHYHYTEVLGPKLFLVPVIIAPAYFGAGYLAWSLGHILIGAFGRRLRAMQIFSVPLIAAFVMVMWDLQMDPVSATIRQHWIWHNGGGYFGVPFVNFMGWLLCVYTVFQLFALYISRQAVISEPEGRTDATDRSYWYQNAAAYVALSLNWATLVLTGQHATMSDATGSQWQTAHIFESITLITFFTMWFVALLSVFLTGNHRK